MKLRRPQDHKTTGPQDHKTTRPQDRRTTGPAVQRSWVRGQRPETSSGQWSVVSAQWSVVSSQWSGFTLIEIAISLAVIAFALVAIIGVLPTGMQVQRDNREETIINQDAQVWLDALRNGQQGLDDLTNYVEAIQINTTRYLQLGSYSGSPPVFAGAWTNTYSYSNSTVTGGLPFSPPPKYPITNGLRIVGLLSTPKYVMLTNNEQGGPTQGRSYYYYSNHVVAFVRAMSGNAADKPPQTSGDVLDLSFRYRMVVELNTNTAYFFATNVAIVPTPPADHVRQNLQANLYDLRLLFRWPLLANGDTGNGRVVFRSMVGGYLSRTNEGPASVFAAPTAAVAWPDTIYFLQPRSYAAQ